MLCRRRRQRQRGATRCVAELQESEIERRVEFERKAGSHAGAKLGALRSALAHGRYSLCVQFATFPSTSRQSFDHATRRPEASRRLLAGLRAGGRRRPGRAADQQLLRLLHGRPVGEAHAHAPRAQALGDPAAWHV